MLCIAFCIQPFYSDYNRQNARQKYDENLCQNVRFSACRIKPRKEVFFACKQSEKGYANLHELESELLPVSFADFNDKYNERDIAARENMRKLIDSDDNKVTKVFSTLI